MKTRAEKYLCKAWGKHDSSFEVFLDKGQYELRTRVIKQITEALTYNMEILNIVPLAKSLVCCIVYGDF